MSGHSKWDTIKRKKGLLDAKKAKEFTKIARLITVAAQNGGGDPNMNPTLALAMDKARSVNMPNDNIDRAIKRGTGDGGNGGRLEEVVYEGYGPNNIPIIIDSTTDNRNRTIGDVRTVVEKAGGRITETGSISWDFKTIGQILMEFESDEEKKQRENAKWNDKLETPKINKANVEEFELGLYDVPGVIDVIVEDEGMEIKTEYSELNNVRKFIDSQNYKIADAGLVKLANNQIELSEADKEAFEEFVDKVEELDDVQKVWTNIKE